MTKETHTNNVKAVDSLMNVLTLKWTYLARQFRQITAPSQTKSDIKERETMIEVLLEMIKMYGIKEIVGKKHNPQILAMFAEIGFDWVDDDETAWCSAALNYFCKKTGYERSGKLDARSWLKLPVLVLKPQLGDIVVLWRNSPNDWHGHVGLYISEDIYNVYVLGGNQGDKLCISPYDKNRVLGYRQARKLENIRS